MIFLKTPQYVAQKLLLGEDLLNPSKGQKGEDGKPISGKVFPMPKDLGSNGLQKNLMIMLVIAFAVHLTRIMQHTNLIKLIMLLKLHSKAIIQAN